MTHTAKPAEWRNLFGVCAALGEDVGFDPLWLRIALSVGVIWNWQAIAVLYAALAAVVLVSRVLIRDPKPVAAAVPLVPVAGEPVRYAEAA